MNCSANELALAEIQEIGRLYTMIADEATALLLVTSDPVSSDAQPDCSVE